MHRTSECELQFLQHQTLREKHHDKKKKLGFYEQMRMRTYGLRPCQPQVLHMREETTSE